VLLAKGGDLPDGVAKVDLDGVTARVSFDDVSEYVRSSSSSGGGSGSRR
jgi:hypothetical protein